MRVRHPPTWTAQQEGRAKLVFTGPASAAPGVEFGIQDDAWLELLLEFGYGQGDGGPWHARLAPAHPTPRETAEDCLMWAALEGFPRRVALLLDNGVDPDGKGTRHPILKDRTALEVALLEGHAATAEILRRAGAQEPELERGQRVAAA